MTEKTQSYILWYESKNPKHMKTRYFVGEEKVPCATHGYHLKPAWTYEKDSATILSASEGATAKSWCETVGYKGLVLEPIDELPAQSKPEEQKQDSPSGSEIVKAMLKSAQQNIGVPVEFAPPEKVH